MGAQKGAHEHALLFISFVFNLLCCVLSPAFAPSDAIKPPKGGFFVSEICATQGNFLPLLSIAILNSVVLFVGDHDPHKSLSENTVNKALRVMDYDTKTEVCGYSFKAMACSSLMESRLWSRDAAERQMSHQERNSVRAAYIHKAEHLGERRLMLQWWADYLDANREKIFSPFDYAKINNPLSQNK